MSRLDTPWEPPVAGTEVEHVAGALDRLRATFRWNRASLRRLVFDLLEEHGRHTGQADLIRESVDGRVGEDPEPGWVWTP